VFENVKSLLKNLMYGELINKGQTSIGIELFLKVSNLHMSTYTIGVEKKIHESYHPDESQDPFYKPFYLRGQKFKTKCHFLTCFLFNSFILICFFIYLFSLASNFQISIA
jgi:hypothetical protein